VLFTAIAAYSLLACFTLWLVVFPARRVWIKKRTSSIFARVCDAFSERKQAFSRSGTARLNGAETVLYNAARGLRQHYILTIGVILLLGIPSISAVLFSSKLALRSFEELPRDANPQIAALLQGEELVAPPVLPPEIFMTQEVEQVRPMLVGASRNWQLLQPDFARRLLLVFKIMKDKYGYDMAILEGYRSPQRQNMLAAMGDTVTNAKAFQSFHQYGLAGDCAFLRNGKLVISEKDPWAMRGYQLYGEVAESVGLRWGGRWKLMDFGHTELPLAGYLNK
jgi:peptidoglycan L-alanyl-D-glutamate endopeptidase CwlK